MTIKPWLSKSFLHQMRWSNVRDYPPKRKKPWLFDNFMEMEETHSDHIEAPFEDLLLPLPPPPEIPQDPEDVEPDPCEGDRSLWVTAIPSTIDCDVSSDFTLLFSSDFRCIELKQLFFDENEPHIVDSAGNTLEHFTRPADIVGELTLERKCDDNTITLMANDCLCGGYATADIWLNNCGATCGAQAINGQSSISPNFQYQYTLDGAQGDLFWYIFGSSTGVSVDSETGVVTTASNACGKFNLRVTDSCCGDTQRTIFLSVGYYQGTVICSGAVGGGCDVATGAGKFRRYYPQPLGCSSPSSCGDAPCNPSKCESGTWEGTAPTSGIVDFEWQCPP
jgi:hypothetical protein